jgi:hypothetical protein
MTWTNDDEILSAPMRSKTRSESWNGREFTITVVIDDSLPNSEANALIGDKLTEYTGSFDNGDMKSVMNDIRDQNPTRSNQWGFKNLRNQLSGALDARLVASSSQDRDLIKDWDSEGFIWYDSIFG